MRSLIIAILACSLLSGCASGNASGQLNEEGSPEASQSQQIEVDQGILTVDITFPASFVNMGEGDYTQDKVDEAVAKEGYLSGKINEDGSVTFTMTKIKHGEMLDKAKSGFDQFVKETLPQYPSVTALTRNDDFTEMRIETTDEDFTLGFLGFSLSFQAYFFHILNGSDFKLDVITISSVSGEELDRTTFPISE